jgi:hypothetical protein
MIYDWYKLFNMQEFLDTGLTSREIVQVLVGRGRTTVLVSRGNVVSLTYDGAFMPVNMIDINPFVVSPYASFLDSGGDVWIGFEVDT